MGNLCGKIVGGGGDLGGEGDVGGGDLTTRAWRHSLPA